MHEQLLFKKDEGGGREVGLYNIIERKKERALSNALLS